MSVDDTLLIVGPEFESQFSEMEKQYGMQAWMINADNTKEKKMYRFKTVKSQLIGVESELTRIEPIYFPEIRKNEIDLFIKTFNVPLMYRGTTYKKLRYAEKMGGAVSNKKAVCCMYIAVLPEESQSRCQAARFDYKIDSNKMLVSLERKEDYRGNIYNTATIEMVKEMVRMVGRVRIGKLLQEQKEKEVELGQLRTILRV